jgi:hypothetical protein
MTVGGVFLQPVVDLVERVIGADQTQLVDGIENPALTFAKGLLASQLGPAV